MNYIPVNYLDFRVALSLVGIIVALLIHQKRKQTKYIFPSGPIGLPFVGHTLSLIREPIHLKLSEWADKFGKIYTIHLGPRPALVINDVGVMKEIFGIYPASTGKLLTDLFTYAFGGKYGLLCVDGQHWQEQRNFCIKNLRNLGFGKGATMEPMLIDEADDLVDWIGKEGANGRPVQVLGELQKATFNALWTLVTGEKIPPGDTRFVDIQQSWLAAAQKATKTGLAFLPWLKYLAPEKSGYNMFHKAATISNQFIGGYIEEHRKSFQEGSPRDLIDAMLEQIQNEKDPRSSFYGKEGWKHSLGTIVTLFNGGGETTATTLTWLIFYLCCEPKVQRKLQEEIDREIGRDREPSLKDRISMPYTDAVILETLRKSTFFPVGLIHELTEDIRFQKYIFPKETLLIANLYHVHHDCKIWGDPEKFRPERFLTREQSLRDNVVGFQVGKRQCLGEGLAKDIMFLFVTKLFQKFSFTTDPSHENKEYLEPDMGFCLATKHLPVVVSCRDGQGS